MNNSIGFTFFIFYGMLLLLHKNLKAHNIMILKDVHNWKEIWSIIWLKLPRSFIKGINSENWKIFFMISFYLIWFDFYNFLTKDWLIHTKPSKRIENIGIILIIYQNFSFLWWKSNHISCLSSVTKKIRHKLFSNFIFERNFFCVCKNLDLIINLSSI